MYNTKIELLVNITNKQKSLLVQRKSDSDNIENPSVIPLHVLLFGFQQFRQMEPWYEYLLKRIAPHILGTKVELTKAINVKSCRDPIRLGMSRFPTRESRII